MLKFNMRYDYAFYRKHIDDEGRKLECPVYGVKIKTDKGEELFMEEWVINNMIRYLKYFKTDKGKVYVPSKEYKHWEQIVRSIDYKE